MDIIRAILYLPVGASSFADGIDGLHAFVITMTMLAATFSFGAAAWFTVRYHRRHRRQLTEHVTASPGREFVIIGTILGVFLLWWVIGYRQYLHMFAAPADADVVYVQAKQWMWKFSYPDGRAANDVLTVPVDRPIRLVMTSRDVIHSFFVPEFRIKHDVLPGRYVTLWFRATRPGTYSIWCAEYCGLSHSQMRGTVVVLGPEDYARWKTLPIEIPPGEGEGAASVHVDGGANRVGDLVSVGREVAIRRACVACHTLDGQRHVGPTFAGLYGSVRLLADGRRVVADDAYLTRSMMEPNAEVVEGYRSVMPTFRGALTHGETAALVELIKSLRAPVPPSGVELPSLSIRAPDGGAMQDPWLEAPSAGGAEGSEGGAP